MWETTNIPREWPLGAAVDGVEEVAVWPSAESFVAAAVTVLAAGELSLALTPSSPSPDLGSDPGKFAGLELAATLAAAAAWRLT